MPKVIIDTNVVVSALIQKSYPYLVVGHILTDKGSSWCVSEEVLAEYHVVLKRDKFSRYPDFVSAAERLFADIETLGVMYRPTTKLNIISDKDE